MALQPSAEAESTMLGGKYSHVPAFTAGVGAPVPAPRSATVNLAAGQNNDIQKRGQGRMSAAARRLGERRGAGEGSRLPSPFNDMHNRKVTRSANPRGSPSGTP